MKKENRDSEVLVVDFSSLCLESKILNRLEELSFHTPSAIQEQAIPYPGARSRLIASAKTGSGKTLVFVLLW